MTTTAVQFNSEALRGFFDYINNSRVAQTTSDPHPGQVLPSKKGFVFVPLDVLRSLLMLPQGYRDKGGKYRKHTVAGCVKLCCNFHSVNRHNFPIDICTEQTLYGRDACLVRLTGTYEEALAALGLKENSKDVEAYGTYLRRRAKTKKTSREYQLFLAQKDTLVEELKNTTSLSHSLLEDWLLVHTVFADNRIFHPLVNKKKEERRKVFKHEMDMVSSQVSLLSKLVKDVTQKESEFTKLVDNYLESGQDIYKELARKDGFECSSRGAAKEHVLKSLFNKDDSWVWRDSGVQSTITKLKETKEYKVYVQSTWMPFVDTQCAWMSVQEAKRKFDKLFIRQFLTSLELTVMTMAAKVLNDECFITVHDAFAFKSAPSKESIRNIEKLSSDLGIRFSYTNYQE